MDLLITKSSQLPFKVTSICTQSNHLPDSLVFTLNSSNLLLLSNPDILNLTPRGHRTLKALTCVFVTL